MGRLMAIEGRKNAQDAKRGKIFTKLIRELTVAARAGGSDPKANPRLRVATDKALAMNMATGKAYLHLGLPAPRRPDVADLFGG